MAADLHQWFGQDIAVSATGDLMTTDDLTKGQQRVLRRLLTSPADYLWHIEYGAGLPLYIGENPTLDVIEAVIRYQIAIEPQVAQDPQANVLISQIFGGVHARIVYTDADAGNPVTLAFDINE